MGLWAGRQRGSCSEELQRKEGARASRGQIEGNHGGLSTGLARPGVHLHLSCGLGEGGRKASEEASRRPRPLRAGSPASLPGWPVTEVCTGESCPNCRFGNKIK